MVNYQQIEERITRALRLERRPVAVLFRETPPAGVPAFEGIEPSGCSFWRIAGDGQTFYTVPKDHYNCPIGSYTHNVALPEDRAGELESTLSLMTSLGYLRMEEVPGIPRLPSPPGVVVYAPLADAPAAPDVVLFRGRPGRIMLLQEAATRAGVSMAPVPLLGRPTCMVLPLALAAGAATTVGCIGNRVYTGISDDELYLGMPGAALPGLAEAAQTIASANAALLDYHRGRRDALAAD